MKVERRLVSFLLSLFFLLSLLPGESKAQTGFQVKELWRGTFWQETPMKWNGKMELYLTYQTGSEDPRPFQGVITWFGLPTTRTKVSGEKSWNDISFREQKCLTGACHKIITGGSYRGNFNESYSTLSGTAQLPLFSLTGRFTLERVYSPEE